MRRALGDVLSCDRSSTQRHPGRRRIYDLRTNRQSRNSLRAGSASRGAMSSSNGGRCREARGSVSRR
jgi:hypothetical protein